MSEESKLKKIGYPALIVLSLGIAGYLTYSTLMKKPINEMPDKPESASPFACTSCEWKGMLTARQQALQQMKGIKVERATTEEGYTTSMRIMTLTCPGCNQIAAKVANQCGNCLEIITGMVCPKCGYDMNAGSPATVETQPAEPEAETDPASRRRT